MGKAGKREFLRHGLVNGLSCDGTGKKTSSYKGKLGLWMSPNSRLFLL